MGTGRGGSVVKQCIRLRGISDEIKGKVKQGVGEVVGDDRMANSGTADQVKGYTKQAWGDTKDAARADTPTSRLPVMLLSAVSVTVMVWLPEFRNVKPKV